ncbi:MAG: endonuclease domain-containing protein [Pirellula sp.]
MKRSRARSREAIEFARAQRAGSNEFAWTLWQWLRGRQLGQIKFRREVPIPPYTVDFCCVARKLVIEVDGESHMDGSGRARDRIRDEFLNGQGYKVLRIPGYDVIRDGRAVIERIERFIHESEGVEPNPPNAPKT